MFLIVVCTYFIADYFRKGLKYCLNLDPFSNTVLHWSGYLHRHVLLNSWLTMVDDLSISLSLPAATSFRSNQETLTISNQLVAEYIIFM